MNKIKELDQKIEELINKPGGINDEEYQLVLTLSKELDVELDKIGTLEEIELPANVLQLDQNKRKRQLNTRVYKNDAQIINMKGK